MSQFALPIAELKPALTGLGKVLNSKASLPVLTTLKLERTRDGWITFSATDLDCFATVRFEQPTEGEPEVLLIPYEDLQKTVKSCGRDEQILIERDGANHASIKYAIGNQYAERKVESLAEEEFPEIPRIKGDSIPLPDSLRESLLHAFECASTDETRYILNGAYLDVSQENCHQVVATDGRHLFSSNSFALPIKNGVLIPTHRFLQWKEFSRDGEWQMKVLSKEKEDDAPLVQISTRRWRFITKQHEGNYPNWRQVVPNSSDAKSSFELDPVSVDAVLQTIARMPCHDQSNFTIGLELTGEKVQLLGKSETSEHWTKVEVPTAKITGRPALVFLNRHFLTKALRFGLTKVDLIDSMSPLRIAQGGRQMIVMPVRSEAVPPTPASQPVPEPNGTGVAEPVNSGTEPPQPTSTERSNVIVNTTPAEEPASSAPQTNASKIEEALELLDSLKDSLQDGITGLKDLGSKLKLMQKEQKTTEREFQSIRSTLRTLQNVKL